MANTQQVQSEIDRKEAQRRILEAIQALKTGGNRNHFQVLVEWLAEKLVEQDRLNRSLQGEEVYRGQGKAMMLADEIMPWLDPTQETLTAIRVQIGNLRRTMNIRRSTGGQTVPGASHL